MDNKKHREDDYLAMSKYEGHPPSKDNKGFATFTEGGEHYFVMHDKAGKAFMRSEGYSSDKARDNGIESVKKNRSDKQRWSVTEARNHFFLCLKAANHQEIAKSGSYKSKADAEAALARWFGGGANTGAKAAGIATTGAVTMGARRVISEKRNELPLGKVLKENRKVIGEKRNIIGEKSRKVIGEKRNVINETRNLLSSTRASIREDDYLKCEAYKGHKVTDTKNNIAFFTGEDKQHYFVVYNSDGSVRLRSEGFKSTANRDDELKEVIKYIDDNSMYSTLKRGKYFINVLKDKKGREVGRSCMSATMQHHVAYVATTITAANIAKKGLVAAAPVAPIAAAGKGCAWWIPLLFLLPLLLHLCIPVPPPPLPPVVKIAAPVAPKVCNCADLTHPIFKIPNEPAPKTTTVLGRAPEYGNSHALSPEQFFNKLDSKFKGSQMEKNFLNGIFKQMGYENGWADATPGMFTAVNVPRGVEGNLGTKVTHKTVYRKLDPTNVRDLKAFRIEAKNYCHLHFMKTCGNHFYFGDCE